MPVSGPKIGAHLVKMATVIEGASVETVTAAADKAAKLHEARIRRDSGGDSKLSGVGASKGKPGNTKVGVKVKVDKSKTKPSALVSATGPLQIINNDTAGHVIRSAYLKGRGRRGFIGPTIGGQFKSAKRKNSLVDSVGGYPSSFTAGGLDNQSSGRPVINIPGVGFRASARHPGTKGKGTWQAGRKTAEPAIAKAMRSRTFNVVKGAAKP